MQYFSVLFGTDLRSQGNYRHLHDDGKTYVGKYSGSVESTSGVCCVLDYSSIIQTHLHMLQELLKLVYSDGEYECVSVEKVFSTRCAHPWYSFTTALTHSAWRVEKVSLHHLIEANYKAILSKRILEFKPQYDVILVLSTIAPALSKDADKWNLCAIIYVFRVSLACPFWSFTWVYI